MTGCTHVTQSCMFGGRQRRPKKAKAAGKLKAGQRSLKYLRDQGWIAEVVEKYIARVEGTGQRRAFAGGYRRDLFGFADVLAFRTDAIAINGKPVTVLAIQTTSRQQIASHLRTYRNVEAFVGRGTAEQAAKKRQEHAALVRRLLAWIAAPGCAAVIHGWEAVCVPKKSGDGDKVVWQLTEKVLTDDDLRG